MHTCMRSWTGAGPLHACITECMRPTQVATLKAELDKGWFEDFEETTVINIIAGNSQVTEDAT